MRKEKLTRLMEKTFVRVNDFFVLFKNENSEESSFENWNARDTLAHLAWWVKFAATKLEYIKENKRHGGVTDLQVFNRRIYESNNNLSINIVFDELKSAMNYFKDRAFLFDDEELESKNFPIGFKFELWRYMALHMCVHHIIHLLYYYLKNEKHKIFTEIMNEFENDILEYSNGDKNIFCFDDY